MIYYLDATSLRLSSCKRKLFYNNILGLRSPTTEIDLVFGKAFHLYAEHNERSNGENDLVNLHKAKSYLNEALASKSIDIPTKKAHLNLAYNQELCMKFNYQWKTDNIQALKSVVTGQPIVEVKFAIPLLADDRNVIMLAGTIDKIAVKPNEHWPYILDYKTTSSWDTKTYLAAYALDPQLRVYAWALRYMYRYGKANPEYYQELTSALEQQVNFEAGIYGGQIYGVFLNSQKQVKFERSKMFLFNDLTLDEFETMVKSVAQELLEVITTKHLTLRTGIVNGSCKGKYGKYCEFFNLCNAPDQEAIDYMIQNNFVSTPYNPLKFT